MTTELRRDRREKQKRQRQRQQQQKRRGSGGITNQFLIGGFVIAAIALAIFGLRAAGVFEPPAAAIDLNSADFQVPAGTTIGTQEPLQQAQHIDVGQHASYNTVPPTSGQHWSSTSPAAPAPWGIKDSNLPNEVTTHNLEHGGIVIGYANLTSAETDQLKSIVRAMMNGTYRKIILEPYPLTDAKVALTSWGWLLKLQTIDQIQIVQFTRSHYSDPNFAPGWNVQ
jgi:Protein of unknown function (DUF3105)